MCFFCVFIAIFIDIEPVQTLVHDAPRDSICKIFILVQAFMLIEFLCQVMPDLMREDKFNIFSFTGYNDLMVYFRKYLDLFPDPFLSPVLSGVFFLPSCDSNCGINPSIIFFRVILSFFFLISLFSINLWGSGTTDTSMPSCLQNLNRIDNFRRRCCC